jgi:hypothetical protein
MIGDAGGFDVVVQILIEIVVTGNIVFLAALFVQPDPVPAALHEIIANLHLKDGTHTSEGVDHNGDQSAIAQAKQIGLAWSLLVISRLLGYGDTLEQCMGLFGGQNRCLALLDRVARAADSMGGVILDNIPGHEPVEQHAKRGQVLLHGRRRQIQPVEITAKTPAVPPHH